MKRPSLLRLCRTECALAVLLTCLIAAALAPAASFAAQSVAPLSLHMGAVELDRREVSVVVGDIPAGASTVALRLAGAEATRLPVPPGESTMHISLAVPGEIATASAEVLDSAGATIAASAHDLTIDTAKFIPGYPRVSVFWDSFVLPSQAIRVTTSRAATITASLGGRECQEAEVSTGTVWNAVVPASVPSGRTRLKVHVRNAWGVRALSVPLWSLRWKPPTSRSVLVDKSDFTLYYAEGYRMHQVYPVAIGMPGTPTRVGTFWLGSPRPAGGPWGVLRMALSKRKGVGALSAWGGYYIHGTNQPDSIGTEASHGCVRMYNSGVNDLSRHTRRRLTSVTIRP